MHFSRLKLRCDEEDVDASTIDHALGLLGLAMMMMNHHCHDHGWKNRVFLSEQ